MISLLNFLRYRQGIATIFNGEYEDQNMNQSISNLIFAYLVCLS
jgi:hypothetical protein